MDERVYCRYATYSSPPRRTPKKSSASPAKTLKKSPRKTAEKFKLNTVAITLRENPLVWKNSWSAIAWHGGKIYRAKTYEVEIVDRLGAGDSFASGFIHASLDGDVQRALDLESPPARSNTRSPAISTG